MQVSTFTRFLWSQLPEYGILFLLPLIMILADGVAFYQTARSENLPSKAQQNSTPTNRSQNPVRAFQPRSVNPVSSHNGIPADRQETASQNSIPELNLKLIGTIMGNGSHAYAIIEDETGSHGKYHAGESVQGATVLKIERDGVVLEKEGREYTLGFSGSGGVFPPDEGPSSGPADSMDKPPFMDPSEEEGGPPHDESIPGQDVPYFEPLPSDTGPPLHPDGEQDPIPVFEPEPAEDVPPPFINRGSYPGKGLPEIARPWPSRPEPVPPPVPDIQPDIPQPPIDEIPSYHPPFRKLTDGCFDCHIYP